MKKKNYITPFVTFDDIEEETGLLLDVVSAGGSNQDADGEWDAKSSSYFCLDAAFEDPFEGPIEEANKEFEYSVNQNW